MVERISSSSKPATPQEIRRATGASTTSRGPSLRSRIAPVKKSPPADQKLPKNPRLRKLREEVKNAMIPLMVEVLERKLEGQQAAESSRLQRSTSRSQEEVCQELEGLLKELKIMGHWGQSCERQALKALSEMRGVTRTAEALSPKVKQSFEQAVSAPIQAAPPKKRGKLFSFVLQWARRFRNNPEP